MANFVFAVAPRPVPENLTSQIDGVTNQFQTTLNFDSQTLNVYYNGQRQFVGISVTIINTTTFTLSFVPKAGAYLFCDYFKE